MEFTDAIVRRERRVPVYVTGRFRSVAVMTAALATVDGVGLGRSGAQEPFLGRDVLEKGVLDVKRQCCDQDDFGLTAAICVTQIRQIAEGRRILDASRGRVVEAFREELGRRVGERKEDARMEMYKAMKFPDIREG